MKGEVVRVCREQEAASHPGSDNNIKASYPSLVSPPQTSLSAADVQCSASSLTGPKTPPAGNSLGPYGQAVRGMDLSPGSSESLPGGFAT